jgi:hypothetical protein
LIFNGFLHLFLARDLSRAGSYHALGAWVAFCLRIAWVDCCLPVRCRQLVPTFFSSIPLSKVASLLRNRGPQNEVNACSDRR